MLTREFATAVDELLRFGKRRNVAVMCAEAAWWQSHRMLLSDALVARKKNETKTGEIQSNCMEGTCAQRSSSSRHSRRCRAVAWRRFSARSILDCPSFH
jgi:hypothetical protein